MPVFEYTALNIEGKNITGIIDAESSVGARQKLRMSKIFPISIKETDKTSAKKETAGISIRRRFARVKASDVTMLTRQLATLVGAGFPLVSAIDTLIPQTRSHGFKTVIAQIKDSIVEGNSFAASLSLFPKVFSPLYINMVSAGETSGTLEIVLDRLADMAEKQQALKNRIRTAISYPILMACFGVLVLFFLMTFIVPTIAGIFADMKQKLPAPTQFLIHASTFLKSYWWMMAILMIGMVVSFDRIKKTEKGRYWWDKLLLSLPIAGTLVKKMAVAHFSRTLGSLLQNGVSMIAALEIVKNIVGNVLLSNLISEATKEVGKGQALGAAIAGGDLFPSLAVQMIQVGEQSGELENMLNKVADVYENDVESAIMSMTAMLEPLMILIMGVLVGFIVLSICLPIFEMNQLVK